ncbi:polyphosphate polymerase domain-containing protein [Arthrobacter burdickii]|uniref:Polyphosphate polymerase domain-containing protein n=1 Tax=Arthrobacter burdickii TaxID=3035920 RepID=A0ABT8JYU7_9MICC|nr:polyphosphate polymerase domain-containing protein [Arthrobacter burdickii]MDN4610344.1 polyphosphate polymerase domain-containing protein [Arthrobacter burdickii]
MTAGDFAGLDARPSISLDELIGAAALQTRVDRKYVVGTRLAGSVLDAFAAEVRVLEMLGRRSFTYDSVYFDTPDLDSYLLAAHGRRRRYKIRTRTYVDSGTSFLEVKTEGARAATVKERIPYALSDSHRLTPEGLDYVNETLACSIGSVPSGVLEPVIETRYRRITLYLPESESRATIDLGVTWRRPGGRPHELDGAVILETKSGSAASALDRHLWASGIRPSRISKFATGMAALDPALPANRWHRTISTSLPLRPLSR